MASGERILRDVKKVSSFAQLLVKVSTGLTVEDVSTLKLILHADNHFTKNHLEDLKNSSDVISHLYHCKFFDKRNLSYLIHLLESIQRKDLVKMIKEYEASNHKMSSDNTMSVDDNDDLPSSQESISDEEKLHLLEKQQPHDSSNEVIMSSLED